MIDPDLYTISIRKEKIEGDIYYVSRIAELPDVEEYGSSQAEAYSLARETIINACAAFKDNEMPFPKPLENVSYDVSGRVTLRMAKSLHAGLAYQAQLEGVSLNSWIISNISEAFGSSVAMNTLKAHIAIEMQKHTVGIASQLRRLESNQNSSSVISKSTRFSFSPDEVTKDIERLIRTNFLISPQGQQGNIDV
jgi:hypothetical protein